MKCLIKIQELNWSSGLIQTGNISFIISYSSLYLIVPWRYFINSGCFFLSNSYANYKYLYIFPYGFGIEFSEIKVGLNVWGRNQNCRKIFNWMQIWIYFLCKFRCSFDLYTNTFSCPRLHETCVWFSGSKKMFFLSNGSSSLH